MTILGLRRLIARIRPELIHAYGWLAFSVATALGRQRIPMLISARDYGYFCANRTLLRKGEPCSGPAPVKCVGCAASYYGPPKGLAATAGVYLCKPALARKMTGLHSVSTYVHDVTTRNLFGPGRCARRPGRGDRSRASRTSTRPSDVDARRARSLAYLERLPAEPFILFVGAFRKVKGLETLFDAYRRLDSPPPLVLMGTYERDSPTEFPPEAVVLTDVPHAGGHGGLGPGDVRGHAVALAGALRRHRRRGDEPRQAGDRHDARRPRRHDRRLAGMLVPAGRRRRRWRTRWRR